MGITNFFLRGMHSSIMECNIVRKLQYITSINVIISTKQMTPIISTYYISQFVNVRFTKIRYRDLSPGLRPRNSADCSIVVIVVHC